MKKKKMWPMFQRQKPCPIGTSRYYLTTKAQGCILWSCIFVCILSKAWCKSLINVYYFVLSVNLNKNFNVSYHIPPNLKPNYKSKPGSVKIIKFITNKQNIRPYLEKVCILWGNYLLGLKPSKHLNS